MRLHFGGNDSLVKICALHRSRVCYVKFVVQSLRVNRVNGHFNQSKQNRVIRVIQPARRLRLACCFPLCLVCILDDLCNGFF